MLELKWDANGLIPVVVQDVTSQEVLMVAYMNKEALRYTLEKKRACFYSRSRKKIWVKGETSGHMQEVVEIFTDCDQDTLVLKVRQKGGACHLGYRTCFVHRLDARGEKTVVTQDKVFDPEKTYS